MEENIRIQLVEMNRLMSYNRSKTLLEQTNDYDLSNIDKQQYGYQDRFANNRYSPLTKIIDDYYDGDVESYVKDDSRSESIKYKGDKKPIEPTPNRGEGYYLDKNGNVKNPNGYWYITYDSPRYKEYYKNTIQPMLQSGIPPFTLLKGKYKQDVWDIYKQDLEDWENRQPHPLAFLADWDAHDWLETGELVTGLIGMFPYPPVAFAGNLLSMGLGTVNAGLYYAEGREYDASIALAFAMMPGPAVYREGKGMINTMRKGGKEAAKKQVVKNVDNVIKSTWRQTLKNSLKETLATEGKHWTFKFLVWLSRTIKNYYVNFAGIPIAFDTLYYLYTLTLKGDEQLTAQEARDKSDFKIIVDILKDPTEIINIMIDVFSNESTEDDIANSEKYVDNAVDSIHAKSPDERERNNMELANERGWKIPPKKD